MAASVAGPDGYFEVSAEEMAALIDAVTKDDDSDVGG